MSQEPAVFGDIAQPRRADAGQDAQHRQQAQYRYRDQQYHLDQRQPELEFAENVHAGQVDHGERGEEQQ